MHKAGWFGQQGNLMMAKNKIVQPVLVVLLLLTACSTPTPTTLPTVTPAPTIPTAAADSPAALNADPLTELESYIVASMELADIPGMSIAIVQDGTVIYAKGFGVRELGQDDPVTPDTLMMIASSTKPLTTLMMATVVDDGLMHWDTPVTAILPTFAVGDPELTQRLTMRHLVCACSGMPSTDSALFFSDISSAEDLIRSMRAIAPVAELEQQFIYSNQMLAAGGYIAALAAGGPPDDLGAGYIAAMQARVFDPIGMVSTTLSLERAQASGNFALPHGKNLTNHRQPMPLSAEGFLRPVMPAGAVWSTAQDMARLLLTELNQGVAPGGNRIVSVENLTQTWEPQVKINDEGLYYASGWMVEDYDGKRLIHHSGNSMGFSTDLAFMPDSSLGIVILTNAESAGNFVHAIRYRLLELAFDRPSQYDAVFKENLEASKQAVLDFAEMIEPELDEQAVAPYLGTFTHPEIGEITLQAEDGTLMLHTAGITTELRQFSGQAITTFVVYDVPWAVLGMWAFQFKPDSNDKPTIVVFEKGISTPFVFVKTGN